MQPKVDPSVMRPSGPMTGNELPLPGASECQEKQHSNLVLGLIRNRIAEQHVFKILEESDRKRRRT
eukprot:560857-Amphidinium_carterae.1